VSEEIVVDEETPVAEDAPKKKRGGRVASPLTAAIRRHEKAAAKLKQAQARADKVQDVADALAEAKAEEADAKAALLEAIGVTAGAEVAE
jgi:hypothetical protein